MNTKKLCPLCYDPHLGLYDNAWGRGHSKRGIAALIESIRKTYERGGIIASREWNTPAPVQSLRTIESQVAKHFDNDEHAGMPGEDGRPELPRDFYVQYS